MSEASAKALQRRSVQPARPVGAADEQDRSLRLRSSSGQGAAASPRGAGSGLRKSPAEALSGAASVRVVSMSSGSATATGPGPSGQARLSKRARRSPADARRRVDLHRPFGDRCRRRPGSRSLGKPRGPSCRCRPGRRTGIIGELNPAWPYGHRCWHWQRPGHASRSRCRADPAKLAARREAMKAAPPSLRQST